MYALATSYGSRRLSSRNGIAYCKNGEVVFTRIVAVHIGFTG
jgi:hypothetical protein